MNIERVHKILQDQPKFRLKQVYKTIFSDLAESWEENTTLPKDIKARLIEECPLEIDAEIFDSKKSDAIKALLKLEDGGEVEAVLLLHNDGRRTVCVSSQVGCALGCRFCATGTMGRKRNVTTSEILSQVLLFARYMNNVKKWKKHNRVTNIVFMGMGEPFMNYDNVMDALRLLNDKDGMGIGARHMSVSTSGIVDGIRKFTEEPMQINLAISIHAPTDELRSMLMPINRKYPLDELMEAVEEYANKRGRQVMFEYIMLDGVNDSIEHARQLAYLLKHPLYMVNLIRYNPTGTFQPSKPHAINSFKLALMERGVRVTQRQTFGQDIDAACGQLALKNKKK
ncbi:MAG: 23S rRNA (adenine(2503)-C(2))-methyltransferase RlmN [Candidatus Magasanikbacteria bacterium]|jgi:23S rRNA (adenine2503-C2)-methyltransferase|nr:23S rRNA (adenine(2503)-C(2))-methyltransferase RlmN [Candidatus Magasanikbacteria bacterium]